MFLFFLTSLIPFILDLSPLWMPNSMTNLIFEQMAQVFNLAPIRFWAH